jgi:tetratricopeptide (TPR) repeat protein
VSDYLSKVNLLFELHRHDDAAAELRRALAENPDDALAHAMLGAALSSQGKFVQALEETRIAIELDPTMSYAFYAKGLVLMRAGRRVEAIAAVRDAIAIDAYNAEYLYVLAWLLAAITHWNEALETVDRALAIFPEHIAALEVRGDILQALGRRDEARQTLDLALSLDPQHAGIHHARGKFLLAGADAAAARHLLEARRLDPLSKNDQRGIALAIGRQMAPFRWINAWLPRWHLWPPKAIWALFTTLVLISYALAWLFLPIGRSSLTEPSHLRAALAAGSPQLWFLTLALNVLLLPFSLDALAFGFGEFIYEQPAGAPPRGRIGYLAGLIVGGAFLIASSLLFHFMVTIFVCFPPAVRFAFAVGSCLSFVMFAWRAWHEGQRTLGLYLAYTALLLCTWFGVPWLFHQPVSRSLLGILAFAPLAFFSDNVARWIRSRER